MKKIILITISIVLFSSCSVAQTNNQFGNSVNADFYQTYVKPFDVEGEINFDLISEIYEVFGMINYAEDRCLASKRAFVASLTYAGSIGTNNWIKIVSSDIETLEEFKDDLNSNYIEDYNLSKDFVNKVSAEIDEAIDTYRRTLDYMIDLL